MRIELLRNKNRVAVLTGGMIKKVISGSSENDDLILENDKQAALDNARSRLPGLNFDDVREVDEKTEATRIEAEQFEALKSSESTRSAIQQIESYTRSVRAQYAVTDSAQAEAYRQVAKIAKRVLAGQASDDDKAILEMRDVEAGTVNPKTGSPVKSVAEAAQLIVVTEKLWFAVLARTDVARKQAISAIKALAPSEIPSDLNAWLAENFTWLPEA